MPDKKFFDFGNAHVKCSPEAFYGWNNPGSVVGTQRTVEGRIDITFFFEGMADPESGSGVRREPLSITPEQAENWIKQLQELVEETRALVVKEELKPQQIPSGFDPGVSVSNVAAQQGILTG